MRWGRWWGGPLQPPGKPSWVQNICKTPEMFAMPRDLTWWTGASQMQAQRSRQSLLRWTRRRRRRCTSSSAPPHDGSQGNRHGRLFRLSPESFFCRIIQIKTSFADYLHCVTSRLHLAREPSRACLTEVRNRKQTESGLKGTSREDVTFKELFRHVFLWQQPLDKWYYCWFLLSLLRISALKTCIFTLLSLRISLFSFLYFTCIMYHACSHKKYIN